MTIFTSYWESITIKDHVKSKHIIVGDYSYYSGYYHGHSFENCVMYLDEKDNHRAPQEIDRLIIGKFCSIASGVKFMMGGTQGHNYRWIAAYPLDFLDDDFNGYTMKGQQLKGDTVVGNDLWVGVEAMIMPGVRVGDGAVIGARTVVTKNVGPYEIWGGNPGQLLKKRFSDQEIEKLLQIKWRDWDLNTIKANLSFIRSNDVETLWARFQEGKL